MKEAIVIILVIILSAGLILVGVGLILTKGNFEGVFQKDVRTEQRIDETDEVTSLRLDIAADNIELYPSADDKLHIDYWDSEKSPFFYNLSNGTATLKQQITIKSWFNWGYYENKTVKVYLPASLNDTLSFVLSSGDLKDTGCNFDVRTLYLNLSSGNVSMKSCSAAEVEARMSSGNIMFEGLRADNLDANVSSGSFSLSDSQISGNLDLDLSSGDAELRNCFINKVKSDMSSGTLTAQTLTTTSVDAKASSGDIILHLTGAEPEEYRLDLSVSSGNTVIEGAGTTVRGESIISGNGDRKVTCKSSSGNIRIYFE